MSRTDPRLPRPASSRRHATTGAALLVLALAAPLLHARPLVYCADASPEGFDPGLWDSASTNNVNNQLFQGLLAFKRGGTDLVPSLAERWEVSPDAKVFTFQLRRGVKFHKTPWFTPTRDFNADDVLFTFGRFTNPEHPFNKAFPAQFIYPQNLGLAQQIEKVEKLDPMRVRITLRQPNVTFLTYLAMAFAGIQPAEYGDKLLKEGKANAINSFPVGTGPYRFVSYRKDDAVRMEANPDHWGGVQKTDKLIFAITRDPTVRVQKLVARECHVTSPVRDVDLPQLESRPDIRVMKTQALNISYLSFNMKRKPTSVREVREALDIAVDRHAIFKAMFPRGDAMQAVNPFPPVVPGYNKALKNEFDPQRAKQLLAKAGYPNGFEITLWALPVVRPTNPNGALMAQMIQQDWARIGVKATIHTYEWGEYLKRSKQGEHDVYMSGWTGDTGDADDFLTPNLTCAASSDGVKFCNAEFDKLVTEARGTTDVAKRLKLYEQAQVVFKRERPWITMAHSTIYIPMLKDVQGFMMLPNGGVDFENVYR
jgi:ABC-type transport system substrate-binding protein